MSFGLLDLGWSWHEDLSLVLDTRRVSSEGYSHSCIRVLVGIRVGYSNKVRLCVIDWVCFRITARVTVGLTLELGLGLPQYFKIQGLR